MRFLFCCESYHPTRGGVQEVMRQIAERMVLAGHHVTVATSYQPERNFTSFNGVEVRGFKITGNAAYGMSGEVDRYQNFVLEFEADAILIKAAQQWTFDALWPILDRIKARKVFIPCGFSGLYQPAYARYFVDLPDVLRKFDHLIFYANEYRDIDFARKHGLGPLSVLPNGANELEFDAPPDSTFRQRFGIADDEFVFLTVGNPIESKGHVQVAEAFSRLETNGRSATLILNGTWRSKVSVMATLARNISDAAEILRRGGLSGLPVHVKRKLNEGRYFARHIEPVRRGFDRHIEPLRRRVRPYLHLGRHALFLFRTEGWLGVYLGLRRRLARSQAESVKAEPVEAEPVTKPRPNISVSEWVERVRTQPGKRVLCTDLARPELVQAFMTADLFVFASTVEYSPLVLYEAAAAGLPFLSGPVGNAEEIATWTGGGLICSALKDKRGYTWVDPSVLAGEMRRCMDCPDMLARLGKAGKQSWRREFTWKAIAPRYEAILAGRPDH